MVMVVVMAMCRMMVVMLLLLLILCTVSGRTTRQGVRMVMVMVVLPRGRALLLMTVRTILATKGSLRLDRGQLSVVVWRVVSLLHHVLPLIEA